MSEAFCFHLLKSPLIFEILNELLSIKNNEMPSRHRNQVVAGYALALLFNLTTHGDILMFSQSQWTKLELLKLAQPNSKYPSYNQIMAVLCFLKLYPSSVNAIPLEPCSFPTLIDYFHAASLTHDRTFRGIPLRELISAMKVLTVEFFPHQNINISDLLTCFSTLLTSIVPEEVSLGIDWLRCIVQHDKNHCLIEIFSNFEDEREFGVIEAVRELQNSSEFDEKIKTTASELLNFIRTNQDGECPASPRPASAPARTVVDRTCSLPKDSTLTSMVTKPKVYLSFHKHEISTVKQLERLITSNNFEVVSSLPSSFPEAKQNLEKVRFPKLQSKCHRLNFYFILKNMNESQIVAICHSEAYNMSPSCRREAELARSLRKKIVSVSVDSCIDYEPQGWLDQLLEYSALVHVDVDESFLQKTLTSNKLLSQLAKLVVEWNI